MTFNQVVRGSNPRCFIKWKRLKTLILLGFQPFFCYKNEIIKNGRTTK
nr:MAG TPA: hypothetical protein [Caudoviricetes sp.]